MSCRTRLIFVAAAVLPGPVDAGDELGLVARVDLAAESRGRLRLILERIGGGRAARSPHADSGGLAAPATSVGEGLAMNLNKFKLCD